MVSWVGTNGIGYYFWTRCGMPYEIVDAYLKVFPSAFPNNSRFEKIVWGRMERDLPMAEMRKRLDAVVTAFRNDFCIRC